MRIVSFIGLLAVLATPLILMAQEARPAQAPEIMPAIVESENGQAAPANQEQEPPLHKKEQEKRPRMADYCAECVKKQQEINRLKYRITFLEEQLRYCEETL